MKKKLLYLLLPILALLVGCRDERESSGYTYDVDNELAPYLAAFEKEAAKRNHTFNLKEDGIIMKFADLQDPTIGLCTYSDPIKVEIDRAYWAATLESQNCINLRENVVFHELAHGLLQRRHLNTTLENDEWKSLMCGNPPASDRNWSVNFNGARKEYYLDELFDMQTPAPSYTYRTPFSGDKGSLKAEKDYEKIPNRAKDLNNGVQSEIKDGLYILTNKTDTNTLCLIENIDNEDFYFEVEMNAYLPSEYASLGLWVSDGGRNTNYFVTHRDDNTGIGNTSCPVQFFCEVNIGELLTEGSSRSYHFKNSTIYNTFALQKKGDELFFYINGTLAYWNDYKLDQYRCVGVIAPALGHVNIRSYRVYTSEGKKIRSAIIKPMPNMPLLTPKQRKIGY